MDPAKRIIVNTIVQYTRSLLNILLSLFSTRYVMEALGQSDYGLYVVVGGVVALLGFITNALVITTQRFISFYIGKSEPEQVRKYLANSILLHLAFSLTIAVILYSLKDLVIYHWLNIPEGRHATAGGIYIITILMMVITILIAPFKAVFIAHENIVYISIVEILDGFLKLGIALCILVTDSDRLLLYAFLMLMVQVFNFLAFFIYATNKFEECKRLQFIRQFDFASIKQILSFAGWSTYGMGAVVLRSQGIQLLLNRSFGTIINAAYGIAGQVFGSVAFVATSVINAMNPQIIKAEGEGNRTKMLHLAEKESKYSTLLLILFIIPILFEMPSLLAFWLKSVPHGADMFCRFILCGFIIDQVTYGLNIANQATGRIRLYTLLMYTPKLLVVIPVYILLKHGYSPFYVMCVYIASEILVSAARLPYMKFTCGLSISHFIKEVIKPLIVPLIVLFAFSFLCVNLFDFRFRFLLTIFLSAGAGTGVSWLCALNSEERQFVIKMVRGKFSKTKAST